MQFDCSYFMCKFFFFCFITFKKQKTKSQTTAVCLIVYSRIQEIMHSFHERYNDNS